MSQSERLLSSSQNPVDKVEVVIIPRELRSSKPEVYYSLGPNEEPLGVVACPSSIVPRVPDPAATPLPPNLSSASSYSSQSSPLADSPPRDFVFDDPGAVPLAVSHRDLFTPPLVVPHQWPLLTYLIFHWIIQSCNSLSIIPWGS